MRRSLLVPVLLAVAGVAVPVRAATPPPAPAPAVVAVVGEASLNVLHEDFRTPTGRDPQYPAGMPRPTRVALPTSGTFAARLAAVRRGVLGHLRPGVLYAVAGTRLLLVNVDATAYDALGDERLHGTGVVDSVVGRRYGTAPDALAVVVLGGDAAAYRWLAAQRWVDIASTSSYTVHSPAVPVDDRAAQCTGAADVRRWSAAGHLLFSSSGNTTDEAEPAISPNGLPETYVVGGVDRAGTTWLPGHTEETDPWYAGGTVVRPYETGERYSYEAAAPDSLLGAVHFGGTSGATPLTAGRAARAIAAARRIVRGGAASGALAAGPGRTRRGPLGDGRLTNAELVRLLHHVAAPAYPETAGRYLLEGYGALNGSTDRLATQVLTGPVAEPVRASDDAADAAAHQARAAVFARC